MWRRLIFVVLLGVGCAAASSKLGQAQDATIPIPGRRNVVLPPELQPTIASSVPALAEFKQAVLGVSEVALNPMSSGSGTNLKMLDYFGSGVPIISTPFGARGLGVEPGAHYIAAEVDGFSAALAAIERMPEAEIDALVHRAREFIEARLSWEVIAERLFEELAGRLALSQSV